ncbi:MAG: D-alanyl-D-alanine carboxypeptidase [Muribaculaceae bacterium]|nr:D-alanyl-D-alanine carboxypeptidase [Muribaculaceae bacterium]
MKYISLLISLILLSGFNSSGQIFNTPSGGIAGYIVTDLSSGNTVIKHNESTALIPASILKCVTSAVALKELGSDYQYITKVITNGIISNDTLAGSLNIIPSGDPTLDRSLVAELESVGIRHILGHLNVNSSEPRPIPSCMLEDVGTDYGVGWSDFIYNNNEMLVNDYMITMPLDNIIAEFESDLRIHGFNFYNEPIENTDSIASHNDKYTQMILEHHSRPLSEIVKNLMFKSDNLAAESVGRALDVTRDYNSALSSLKSSLSHIGLDTTSIRIVDFNGLSRTNLITPAFINSLLIKMRNNKDLIASVPKVGQQGTVKRLLSKTSLEGHLALKSGSMTGVLAYAGYKLDTSGKPTHSVVIIVNNTVCKQSQVKRAIEQWLLKIF